MDGRDKFFRNYFVMIPNESECYKRLFLNDNAAAETVIDDESIFNVQKISAEAMTKPLTYGLPNFLFIQAESISLQKNTMMRHNYN